MPPSRKGSPAPASFTALLWMQSDGHRQRRALCVGTAVGSGGQRVPSLIPIIRDWRLTRGLGENETQGE